ncbi:xanthine permease [Starkeya sp. ORNL1]|nr:xanthine permease [Starkeya sp. ORNL1]
MGLMAVTLVFPLLVAQAAGADNIFQARYVALSMLALGVATLAQAWSGHVFRLPRVGSGFLLPAVFTAAYLPASLAAAKSGGLEAVAGLTITAGATEIVLSRFISRLRPYLPIEIVGLVVLMIGMILGTVALKLMVGFTNDAPLAASDSGAAMAALAVMIALSVWGGARVRTMAVLIGLAAGTILHAIFQLAGGSPPGEHAAPLETLVWPLIAPGFDVALLPGFLVGALACTLRAFGDIVASQKANDREWKRPDYSSIEAGALADGLGTLIAGVIGTMGLNTYSASVGLSVATEVLSRRVAIGVGFGWIALAFLPGSSSFVLAIPQSVLGAALLFASAFVVLSGVSILGQRMLDSRRTIAVGLGFLLGISFDEIPALYAQHLPQILRPVVSSSLVLGLVAALTLNALFRIGSRRSHRLTWDPATGFKPLRRFLLEVGGLEGARLEAVARLSRVAEEFNEAAAHLSDGSPIEVSTGFDEYMLELRFAWHGRPLVGGTAPSLDADVDEDAMMNGVVLALIARLSDRMIQRELPDKRHELTCVVDQ